MARSPLLNRKWATAITALATVGVSLSIIFYIRHALQKNREELQEDVRATVAAQNLDNLLSRAIKSSQEAIEVNKEYLDELKMIKDQESADKRLPRIIELRRNVSRSNREVVYFLKESSEYMTRFDQELQVSDLRKTPDLERRHQLDRRFHELSREVIDLGMWWGQELTRIEGTTWGREWMKRADLVESESKRTPRIDN